MEQPKYPALIYGVSPEEYGEIKDVESDFIEYLKTETTFHFEPRYNPNRKAVGLQFFQGREDKGLILFEHQLPETVRGSHERIRKSLERKLDEIRILQEEWQE